MGGVRALACGNVLTTSPLHTEVASTEPESVTPAPMVVLDGAEILTEGVELSAFCYDR